MRRSPTSPSGRQDTSPPTPSAPARNASSTVSNGKLPTNSAEPCIQFSDASLMVFSPPQLPSSRNPLIRSSVRSAAENHICIHNWMHGTAAGRAAPAALSVRCGGPRSHHGRGCADSVAAREREMTGPTPHFDGAVHRRVDPGYEAARCRGFNRRIPDRFPDVIVDAASDEDLVRAVLLARDRGLKVSARSGGHSWSAAFLRDGGVLIDLSQMRDVTVDRGTRTAVAQPGITSAELDRRLRAEGLFFPGGHCGSVALGGFLLWGGVGFNSRVVGP